MFNPHYRKGNQKLESYSDCRRKIAEYFKNCIANKGVVDQTMSSQQFHRHRENLNIKDTVNTVINYVTCGFFSPFQLNENEKKALDLYKRFQMARMHADSSSKQLLYARARSAYKFNSVVCNELAACLFLEIIEVRKHKKYKEKIEAVNIEFTNGEYHCFIIENRIRGDLLDMRTWNKNATLHCAWYNISCTVEEYLNNPQYQNNFPEIGPLGENVKSALVTISIDQGKDWYDAKIPEKSLLSYYEKNKSEEKYEQTTCIPQN